MVMAWDDGFWMAELGHLGLELVKVPSRALLLSQSNNVYIELNDLQRAGVRNPEDSCRWYVLLFIPKP